MDELLLELSARYCEPHRAYHNLRHIAEMLLQGRAFPLSAEQVMAVWFHDAIYDPKSRTNEADSAELARRALTRLGWNSARIELVAAIVLDTASHEPKRPESEPVLDLDLAVLAGKPDAYASYVAAVRCEYAFVAEPDWRKGRREWAQRMLARERLFFTEWGRGLEPAARRNLAGESTA